MLRVGVKMMGGTDNKTLGKGGSPSWGPSACAIEKVASPKMNAQEAADILGVNRRRHGDLLEMLRALTLYPWLNTAEDEKRRVAARWVLTHWKEYQDECARRREAPPIRARSAGVRRRPR